MEDLFYRLELFLKRQVSRGKFLKVFLGWLAVFIAENRFLKMAFAKTAESEGRPKRKIKGNYDLVVSEGPDSYQNTIKAIEALGGMGLFVKKGAVVVIKPNMGWDRTPEQAANTDPGVIAALTEMCYKAGAKRVNIFDIPCNDERRCYENSGIEKAAKEKGAYVYFANQWNAVKAKFPYKSQMERWSILRDAVQCDTFINVPVLKHHSLAGLTLSMKNLMGICGGMRGLMHPNMGEKLVDLTGFINPELTVIDATRYLTKNGPSGGNVADVTVLNKVVAATDPVLADAYAGTLAGKDPLFLSCVKEAVARNFGSADIAGAKIFTVPT